MAGKSRTSAAPAQRWRIAGWAALAGLLLLPAVAMQFTSEVNWDETDFIVMGALLAGLGLSLELVLRLAQRPAARAAAALAVLALFFLIWVELAVGILGPG